MSLLIDVRTAEEYAESHVSGALHLPLVAITCGNLGVLADTDKSMLIELYCRSGSRSEQARQILLNMGFEDVVNLGGLSEIEKK